ncbi:MAG: HlyD family efflux transporter periplasmic adaptor subunit [Anaerolineae bacterium]|jgi:HlyD family secretion protein|nr:HlyD family efflux transporter periplasmic adaptor subunit [Anaerolineae bacterium]MBT7069698.1 HlyD family efflux transporter periplasmic adaptor subunit [Anaerolineae bacterium]MBT7323638.1 HlyD family efflux transporter periplasmic adaptor subunit [Anaerolineae bacterium]
MLTKLKKLEKKTLWIALAVIALFAVGGVYASQSFVADTATADEPAMQTAKIRQGDLTLYASGTGTLISAAEASFGFRSSGQLLSLSASVGDTVEAGDLLAELDNTSEEIQLRQAERELAELTSPAAIATAEQALAQAELDATDAKKHLAYLISWDVLKSEERVAAAEIGLVEAKESGDEDKITAAEFELENAENVLAGNWDYYENHYVADNFKVSATRTSQAYIAKPTEFDILEGRAGYALAQAELIEAENYLAAIQGEEIPADATGSSLAALEQAKLNVLSAQDNLEATQLHAPISGLVMSIDANIGDVVGTSAIVTIADISEAFLEIFLDETDWGMIAVDYPVDVIFDVLPDKVFAGAVVQVDPALYTEQNTSVVRALVRLDESSFDGSKLPIGSAAAVEVIGGRASEAVLVPVEALREASPGQYTVFVMVDDEPKLRVVEVGIQDLFYAEILSGLEVGDVVTTGIAETE